MMKERKPLKNLMHSKLLTSKMILKRVMASTLATMTFFIPPLICQEEPKECKIKFGTLEYNLTLEFISSFEETDEYIDLVDSNNYVPIGCENIYVEENWRLGYFYVVGSDASLYLMLTDENKYWFFKDYSYQGLIRDGLEWSKAHHLIGYSEAQLLTGIFTFIRLREIEEVIDTD